MFEEIIGNSKTLDAVLTRVTKVAPKVLITGETGTGKELIARAIHKQSPRSQNAFISVKCSALAPSLILSELFGHEKGHLRAQCSAVSAALSLQIVEPSFSMRLANYRPIPRA